ncbi:alpha/beta hydrolase fold-3 domain-containing protein [Paraphaeosphaeria sporulosa]|uniref:Alpha/beta hydrolase fold-3 domain-containing protein n=1 Tax=Paraphaeosphaeria sporulosa TaxID=1460663 RepID=A0A177BZR8_9PLEO|nr:alpha/beta hydrolase fold-3 domain-containing protein [Paraphaeosphaeria sporulosa]OAG00209.1 alpha/beta hydrolase fold-3 domain-containing protein [Paraphaeosphaeria sporulosa]
MATLGNVLATQPFKTLYVVAALLVNLAKLPFWIAKYTLVRQHPAWSFRQALALRMTRAFISVVSVVRMRTPLPLTPGKEGARFAVIAHRAEDAGKFKGPMLANAQTVQPGDVGATWYPARLEAGGVAADTRVLVHIHGGAYVVGDGRTEATGYLARSLLKHTPATHVVCPQYRLSTLPAGPASNPFPAALQDALTAYLFVLHELKVPAERVILGGDSAGANCAIALLRYIDAYGGELDIPPPGAALLWSPWINPTDGDTSFVRTNPHYGSDYIEPSFTSWGVCAFAGQDPPLAGPSIIASNPYANAKVSGFRTPVPLYVNVGGAEVLYFDGKEWAEMMRKEGNAVHLDITEGVCHDLFMVAGLVGMEKKATEMAKSAGEWLRGLTRK